MKPPLDVDEVTAAWTESELREYFAGGGALEARPEERDISVAGGTRKLTLDPRSCPQNGPKMTDTSHHTAAVYRRVAFANGIPFRRNGLFPLGDELLTRLSRDATLQPFQKNVSVAGDPHYVVADSWATGDLAAANGPKGGSGFRV